MVFGKKRPKRDVKFSIYTTKLKVLENNKVVAIIKSYEDFKNLPENLQKKAKKFYDTDYSAFATSTGITALTDLFLAGLAYDTIADQGLDAFLDHPYIATLFIGGLAIATIGAGLCYRVTCALGKIKNYFVRAEHEKKAAKETGHLAMKPSDDGYEYRELPPKPVQKHNGSFDVIDGRTGSRHQSSEEYSLDGKLK